MAVSQSIKHGDDAIKDKDFLGAIQYYTQAIKESPQAFQAFVKRSVAYMKLKNLDLAKKDISTAFTIANERGRRSDIGLCYFRLALIYYQEKKLKLALSQLNKAIEYDCKESTVKMWKDKCEYDLKTHPEWDIGGEGNDDGNNGDDDDDDDGIGIGMNLEEEQKNEVVPQKSSNIEEMNKIAPMSVKIREDWYQSSDEVIITIYAKNVEEDKLKVQFDKDSLSVSFPSATGSEYHYDLDPLYGEIQVSDSKYKIYSTKLEITLKKRNPGKWPALEKGNGNESSNTKSIGEGKEQSINGAPAYPSSAKKKINWDNFQVEEDKGDSEPNQFFQKIFQDMDDDSRRAMMKSYIQSNGTVLTTSWEEARDKEFETSPPEGMIAKKWGQ
ncbi:SGT1 [Candida oxycetoniae]|uniref:SGT1 n=1 Tax=Candida oxycetoniae TaxID=497107 RepID=A0AAI9SWP6_9ASCO|nr:SGT1 [Candida oxycetoniae]KAI3404504.2 SGT1 [Candida oxycetoniae]